MLRQGGTTVVEIPVINTNLLFVFVIQSCLFTCFLSSHNSMSVQVVWSPKVRYRNTTYMPLNSQCSTICTYTCIQHRYLSKHTQCTFTFTIFTPFTPFYYFSRFGFHYQKSIITLTKFPHLILSLFVVSSVFFTQSRLNELTYSPVWCAYLAYQSIEQSNKPIISALVPSSITYLQSECDQSEHLRFTYQGVAFYRTSLDQRETLT